VMVRRAALLFLLATCGFGQDPQDGNGYRRPAVCELQRSRAGRADIYQVKFEKGSLEQTGLAGGHDLRIVAHHQARFVTLGDVISPGGERSQNVLHEVTAATLWPRQPGKPILRIDKIPNSAVK
jgi:hypothetical protein